MANVGAFDGSATAPDTCLPATPVEQLLASADDLVARIRLNFGLDREGFDRDVLPLLHRYASYVHLLPATAANCFSAPGGLLRLGLEVAFFSLQGTDAHIFGGGSTITTRRLLEPRWRLATFVGGLCGELHRAINDVVVTDPAGEPWPAYLLPLADWLAARQAEHYELRWQSDATRSRAAGLFALPHVVPPATLQFLAEGNSIIVPHLLASLGGDAVWREPNVLDKLVRRALALVVDRNLRSGAQHRTPRFGAHVERLLIDAMHRLARHHSAWTPNRDKSRVWFGADGIFLVWPQAAAEMVALLEAEQLAGVPKSADVILDLLLAAGVFERRDAAHPTWVILPPDAKVPLDAVKLASPALVFAGLEATPCPLDARLAYASDTPSPSGASGPTRASAPSGTQFSLLDPPPAAPSQHSPCAAAASIAEAAPTASRAEVAQTESPSHLLDAPAAPFKLDAPLRLNPAVRAALESVVDSLNGPGAEAAACALPTGLFVPLHEFVRRGIQPAMAVRALSDVGLLVHNDRSRPPIVSCQFRGTDAAGIVLDPRYVEGFDLGAFAAADQAGA